MAGHSVLDRAHPAGVPTFPPTLEDIAPGKLRTAARYHGGRRPGPVNATLAASTATWLAVSTFEDLVHPVERDQQPTSTGRGPGQAAPGPAGRHWHTVFRGGLQQLGKSPRLAWRHRLASAAAPSTLRRVVLGDRSPVAKLRS